ncbi:5-Hydroxymethylcytosine binding [Abortiporus biennis]
MSTKYWLMKAEPDSRIVKGKDVKFSVDDFESIKTTPWEGVRNYEARNLMKEMQVGDKVLFYHSNCKNPGIAGFAEVSKEAYPDYTAWDKDHPYYDEKTDKDNPKWFMVELTFKARLKYFVPLSLLKSIASLPSSQSSTARGKNKAQDSTDSELPEEIAYIGKTGVKAISDMPLVSRGRLSVQRVDESTWKVVEQLGERGGWDEAGIGSKGGKGKRKQDVKVDGKPPTQKGVVKDNGGKRKNKDVDSDDGEDPIEGQAELRRSKRTRK